MSKSPLWKVLIHTHILINLLEFFQYAKRQIIHSFECIWIYLLAIWESRPGGTVVKLVGTSEFNYYQKKGQKYLQFIFFSQIILWLATFLQKLVGTNPNRPHMFRRAWGMWHFGSQFSYLNQAFKIPFLPISHALQLIKWIPRIYCIY